MAVETMPVPRDLLVVLSCDACPDFAIYQGTDYIEMRGVMAADGWRRRGNKWFKGDCVQQSKDDEE